MYLSFILFFKRRALNMWPRLAPISQAQGFLLPHSLSSIWDHTKHGSHHAKLLVKHTEFKRGIAPLRHCLLYLQVMLTGISSA